VVVSDVIQTPQTDIKVIEALNNIRDNHIHTIEENVKRMDQENQDQYRDMSDRMTRIETILTERLLAKQ
jgi:hypothetical protein